MRLMKHQNLRMGERAVDCAPLVYGMTVCADMQRWNVQMNSPLNLDTILVNLVIWSGGFNICSWLLTSTVAKEVPHLPSLTTRWWWIKAVQWSAFVKSSHLADSGCMPNIYWHTRGLWSKRLGMFLVESTTKKMRGSWRFFDFQDLEISERLRCAVFQDLFMTDMLFPQDLGWQVDLSFDEIHQDITMLWSMDLERKVIMATSVHVSRGHPSLWIKVLVIHL